MLMSQLGPLGVVLQTLATGYMLLDMLLVSAATYGVAFLGPRLAQLWRSFSGSGTSARFTRVIENTRKEHHGGCFFTASNTEKHRLLREVLMLYVASRPHLVRALQEAKTNLVESKKHKSRSHDTDGAGDAAGDDGDGDAASFCSDASDTSQGYLDLFKNNVNIQARDRARVAVEDGIQMHRHEESYVARGDERSAVNITTTTITRCSNERDGNERIDTFVDKRYMCYKAMKRQKPDNTRYLFTPFTTAPPAERSRSQATDAECCSAKPYRSGAETSSSAPPMARSLVFRALRHQETCTETPPTAGNSWYFRLLKRWLV